MNNFTSVSLPDVNIRCSLKKDSDDRGGGGVGGAFSKLTTLVVHILVYWYDTR